MSHEHLVFFFEEEEEQVHYSKRKKLLYLCGITLGILIFNF